MRAYETANGKDDSRNEYWGYSYTIGFRFLVVILWVNSRGSSGAKKC